MGRRKKGELMEPVDASIIALVQQDGRISNTAIAKAIGLSESAVRKRIGRLVKEEIIHFRAHADPLKFGFQIWAVMEIDTVPQLTTQVAEEIAKLPGIIVVGLVTGNYDVYAVGLFRSTEEFNAIIVDRLRKIKGVVRTTTSYVTKAIKRDFNFGVPVLADLGVKSGEGVLKEMRRQARKSPYKPGGRQAPISAK